jgi:hypothetical protein
MRYSELPRALREKIRGYYAEVWTRHEEVHGCCDGVFPAIRDAIPALAAAHVDSA